MTKKLIFPEPQPEPYSRTIEPNSAIDWYSVYQLADYAVADLVKANPLEVERGVIYLTRVVDYLGTRYKLRIKLTAKEIGKSPAG